MTNNKHAHNTQAGARPFGKHCNKNDFAICTFHTLMPVSPASIMELPSYVCKEDKDYL